MAIQKTLSLQNNFGTNSIFDNAYIKVESINMDKTIATAQVSIKESANGVFLQQIKYQFPVDLEGKNAISQAYSFIKTLPEFEGATDC
jgi:hypothetical protein